MMERQLRVVLDRTTLRRMWEPVDTMQDWCTYFWDLLQQLEFFFILFNKGVTTFVYLNNSLQFHITLSFSYHTEPENPLKI